MTLGPFQRYAGDLAPGDRGVLDACWSSFTVDAVRSSADPVFDEVYDRLAREFAGRGEMERREVIEDRFSWDPRKPVDGHALLYEMLVVRHEGEIVAVRDHTAISPPAALATGAGGGVVVHLSHVLVEPSMRGRGLASWLRALPIETARRCAWLAREGDAAASPVSHPGSPAATMTSARITLVAEMEHDDGSSAAIIRRLRSYARAGFSLVDPSRVTYHQPDFRRADEIDRSGVQSVPLSLVVRRVGDELEGHICGAELRELVSALHAMFAVHVRRDHMDEVRALLASMPAAAEQVALLVPGPALATASEALR